MNDQSKMNSIKAEASVTNSNIFVSFTAENDLQFNVNSKLISN
jgi:hypothetical protein